MKYFCAMHETLGNVSRKALKAMEKDNICLCCERTFATHTSMAFTLGEIVLVNGVAFYDKIEFCNCFVTVEKGRAKQTTESYHNGVYESKQEVIEAYNKMEQESRARELEEEFQEKSLALP